ncbi:MAG TPA: YetF domain-containing protein [Holophagaceae bacterium]|nr:YetF domain-containing protein [Holophagaceae bacterium]
MLLLDGSLPVGQSMWHLAQPWWEFALRALLVYGFLLVTLRLTGKRQVGQLAPFDLVLLLVLSNAVQNSMNAGDNTVGGGFILVLTLLGVNALVGWITYRSKTAELIVEGKPLILVHDGVTDEKALCAERITRHELMAAVRQAGLTDLDAVRYAILETNGRINVVPKGPE